MPRVDRGGEEAFGNDSFLDVVANIVGILIILVVVASMRIKHLPSPTAAGATSGEKAAEALAGAEAESAAVEREIMEISEEMQRVSLTAASRYEERAQLAGFLAKREHELADRRDHLSGMSQEEWNLQQEKAQSEREIALLERERAEIDTSAPPPVEIKVYPTPLSRTVYGLEAHYQLKNGRISSVPFDELLRKCKHKVMSQLDRLREANQFADTVGPIDGFRMKYVIERVDVPADQGHGGGSYVKLRGCLFLPLADDLGEPVELAFADQSQFHNSVAGLDPHTTTVTLWTYGDSFALFREVRKHLHEMGFAVAGRPLHDGQPIGASEDGSKSSAQ